MPKYARISVTTLEQFRRYKQFDYITEEKMMDKIKGVFERNSKMDYGEDFGAYIENPSLGLKLPSGAIRMPAYKTYLAPAIVEAANEYIATLQSPVFEVPVRATYIFHQLPPIIISGRQDVIEGRLVRDVKTTSDFDYDTYEESLQWKFYLDMLSVDQFVYDVFELKGKVEDPNDPTIKVPERCDLHSFSLFAYPTLKKDVRGWLSELMAYIDRKGLMDYVMKEHNDDPELSPVITDGNEYV